MIVLSPTSRIEAGVHAPHGLHIINALPESLLVFRFGLGPFLYTQFSLRLRNAVSQEQQ